jgi:AbrB family looped-hinge helix DNA binding protein
MAMGIFTARTSMKGQVTVPAEVRKLLGLAPGGKLQFRTSESGKVEIVAKKRGAHGLRGIFPKSDIPLDIDAAIMAEVAERNRPGSKGSRS